MYNWDLEPLHLQLVGYYSEFNTNIIKQTTVRDSMCQPQWTFGETIKGSNICSDSDVPALDTYWHGKEDCVTAATASVGIWGLCAFISRNLQTAWSACPSSTFCTKRHQHRGNFLISQKCFAEDPAFHFQTKTNNMWQVCMKIITRGKKNKNLMILCRL